MIQLKKVEGGEFVFVGPNAIALIEKTGETRCRVFRQAGGATDAAVCLHVDMSAGRVVFEIEDLEHNRAQALRR